MNESEKEEEEEHTQKIVTKSVRLYILKSYFTDKINWCTHTQTHTYTHEEKLSQWQKLKWQIKLYIEC